MIIIDTWVCVLSIIIIIIIGGRACELARYRDLELARWDWLAEIGKNVSKCGKVPKIGKIPHFTGSETPMFTRPT